MSIATVKKSANPAPASSSERDIVPIGFKGKYPVIKAFAQAIACAVLAIACLEGIFALAGIGETEHLRPDLRLGFKPIAGKHITQRKEGFASLAFNSQGMQNDEIPFAKPAGVFRIAIFGDSYVESLQVPRSKNYCAQLGEMLSAKWHRPVQVINFGVSNYSVAQDYLRYLELGKRYAPDMVILAFRSGESEKLLPAPSNALAFVRPVFFVRPDGGLTYDNTVVRDYLKSRDGKWMAATDWLREHSRIWSVIGRLQLNWLNAKAGIDKSLQNFAWFAGAPKAAGYVANLAERQRYLDCHWPMMDGLLRHFSSIVQAHGAKMVLMRTPMVHPGKYDLDVNPLETRLLEQTARAAHCDFVDVNAALMRDVPVDKYPQYFCDGGHFDLPLHHFVAERLANDLLPPEI